MYAWIYTLCMHGYILDWSIYIYSFPPCCMIRDLISTYNIFSVIIARACAIYISMRCRASFQYLDYTYVALHNCTRRYTYLALHNCTRSCEAPTLGGITSTWALDRCDNLLVTSYPHILWVYTCNIYLYIYICLYYRYVCMDTYTLCTHTLCTHGYTPYVHMDTYYTDLYIYSFPPCHMIRDVISTYTEYIYIYRERERREFPSLLYN